MEFIVILGLFIIIVLLFSIKGSLEKEINVVSLKLDRLRSDLNQLKNEQGIKKEAAPKEKSEEIYKERVTPPVPIKEEPVITPPAKKPEIIIPSSRPGIPQERIAPKPKVTRPTFFERNPDLEKFIGENLINKIGIGILVLGIGFFVKYAIDQDWINEIGRVSIGILCGGILVGFAHKTRKNFKAFSSVLVGGGMAVFYFTIAIAFHEYHIFSQTAAFAIMVIITVFSVLLSIVYDRAELAVLAIIGGFASPFMVSTGEGNYIVLFSYTLLLNTGMLVLAYFKKWNIVNIISYVFTIILYGGWVLTKVEGNPDAPLLGAFIFATLFYLVFFVMNIINNIKENRKFIATEVSILLSNTFLYYTAGMIILDSIDEGIYKGLFTALIAIFNFIFAFVLFKNKKADLNLVYLLIGLVLTFLSLAAPVQLEGNYITLFWSLEAVLLLWLSQKSGIKLMKLGSILVNILMFISLIMDWFNIYQYNDSLQIIFNKGFITSVISIACIYLSILLLKKEEDILVYKIPKEIYSIVLKTIFILFLYTASLLELSYQLDIYFPYESIASMIIGSYNFTFIIGLILFTRKKGSLLQNYATTGLGVIGIISFMIIYHQDIISVRDIYLTGQTSDFGKFAYHYIDTILIIAIIVLTLKNVITYFKLQSGTGKAYLWFMVAALVFIASAELDHIIVLLTFTPGIYIEQLTDENHRIGFPILWGICSFVLMIIGMNKKNKDLRVISLTLFFITILKLFIYDIRDISEGGKIAAFICLGILLLVVSFMYQKLKHLVLEDDPKLNS